MEKPWWVPAGISAGRSLRLRGKGWPLKGGRGDLLLTVQLNLPKEPTAEERQLYVQLRELEDHHTRTSMVENGKL